MRIIQSLKTPTGIADRNGWLSPEFNWMSWALSCLQLKTLHGNVELYTDSYGKYVLIDILQLPYSKVHVVLDGAGAAHHMLWAYSKLIVYALQQDPYVHIDGDVFLWERIGSHLLEAPLF